MIAKLKMKRAGFENLYIIEQLDEDTVMCMPTEDAKKVPKDRLIFQKSIKSLMDEGWEVIE